MKMNIRIIILGLCIGLITFSAGAADYNNWIKLLPKKMGGLAASGEPNGMNMNMGGQAWSSLQQEYTGKAQSAELIIVNGAMAPQVQTFQMMTQMHMETQEQIIKTVDVSGYKAIFQLDKNEKEGNLTISLNQQTVVAIQCKPATSEKTLIDLAKDVPLGKIAGLSN